MAFGVRLDDVDTEWVPGAWELPAAAERLLATERRDGANATVDGHQGPRR